jgi:hypothetical protein
MDRAGEVAQVETFRPRVAPMMAVGWYILAAFGGYDLVRRGDGREVPVGLVSLALITVVVYAIAQRPAVIAGPSGVLLRNVVRDVWLPWHAVKSIEAKWSLSMATQDRTFGSWAVSGSNVTRPRRQRVLGAGPVASPPPVHVVSWTVPDRLEQLRRRGLHGERSGTVEVRPAWPVIAAFLGAVVALVLLLAIPAG